MYEYLSKPMNNQSKKNNVIQRARVIYIDIPGAVNLRPAAERVKKRKDLKDPGLSKPILDFGSVYAAPVVRENEMLILKSHGGEPSLFEAATFGGMTAKELADRVISNGYLPNNYSGRITLSGCSTAVEYSLFWIKIRNSFAENFRSALIAAGNKAGINFGTGFEVKGTLGTAATGIASEIHGGKNLEGALEVEADTFHGDIEAQRTAGHIFKDASNVDYVVGKTGKKVFR